MQEEGPHAKHSPSFTFTQDTEDEGDEDGELVGDVTGDGVGVGLGVGLGVAVGDGEGVGELAGELGVDPVSTTTSAQFLNTSGLRVLLQKSP
jgi:hypothetical protein